MVPVRNVRPVPRDSVEAFEVVAQVPEHEECALVHGERVGSH